MAGLDPSSSLRLLFVVIIVMVTISHQLLSFSSLFLSGFVVVPAVCVRSVAAVVSVVVLL